MKGIRTGISSMATEIMSHISALGCCLVFAVCGAQGTDDWGGIAKHIAVVNSVNYEKDDPMRISLRGEWDFCDGLDNSVNWTRNLGAWSNGYRMDPLPKSARKVMVPGCWEAQGVGTNAMSVTWACHWDCIPQRLKHRHVGIGFYRKDVKLPREWSGKRVWIKVGGVNSQGWLWVNDDQVAWLDTYCGTYKYEITDFVRPGESTKIVCEVSNALPSRRGCMAVVNHWGGILRDVELEATPSVFIDDAWVRGDFDRHVAETHVTIDGGVDGDLSCRVTVEGGVSERSVSSGENVLEVPLADFRPWSPEHPNLYVATIELLRGGKVEMRRKERFGVRKIEVRGKQLYLNDRPFFVRGAGWHPLNPKDGEDLPDRDAYRRTIANVREAGFNLVRCHTHCKWPEFFEAADELGLLVQAELPYYNDAPTDLFEFNPLRDARELCEHFRRHPSFAIYSCNNEGWFGNRCSERLYQELKRLDRDRLVNSGDASFSQKIDHPGISDLAGGPPNIWPRGSCDPDKPFICHEYLNVAVKFDTRDAVKFDNAVWDAPYTREDRRKWLGRFGLDMAIGDRLQDAQNRFQAIWIRHGIESARLDPNCDGYSFWSLQDCLVPQSKHPGACSAQALFDIFWGEKRCGLSISDVKLFNRPSVLLLDTMPQPHLYRPSQYRTRDFFDNLNRVWEEGSIIPARVFLAHYENEDLANGELTWRLVSEKDGTLASGRMDIGHQRVGGPREVAQFNVIVPKLDRACKATLNVSLQGCGMSQSDRLSVSNGWDMWLFPKSMRFSEICSLSNSKGVVVAAEGSDEANAALSSGGCAITLAGQDGLLNAKPGWWWMGDQVGTVLANHPVLKYLPHDGLVSPLLFRILKKGRKLPIIGVQQKDLIVIGEGGGACYSYLHYENMPNGARRIAVTGLDLSSDTPEGNAILRGAIEYLTVKSSDSP